MQNPGIITKSNYAPLNTSKLTKPISDNCIKNILDYVLNKDVMDFKTMVEEANSTYGLAVNTLSMNFNDDELEDTLKYMAQSLTIRHSKNLIDNIVIQLTQAIDNKCYFDFSLAEESTKDPSKKIFSAIKYTPTKNGHKICLNHISFILCDELSNKLESLFNNTSQLL
jgi:hypothetical protein